MADSTKTRLIRVKFILISIISTISLGKKPRRGGIPPIFNISVYSKILFFLFKIRLLLK